MQICDYFRRVMDEHHVESGQVRFFPMSNYLGLETSDVAFVATLTGTTTEVKVRRAIVDARYLEPTIPSRHSPSFAVDPDVRCVPVNSCPTYVSRRPATRLSAAARLAPMCALGFSRGATPTTSGGYGPATPGLNTPGAAARTCDRHGRRCVALR